MYIRHIFSSKSLWIIKLLCVALILDACDTPESVKPNQGQTFIKLYGGNGSEEGKNLVQLSDGGFVIVGSSTSMTSESSGGKDVYVVRTDNIGNVMWERRYGGAGDDVGSSVIVEGNNIYVCGEITQDSLGIFGLRDVYVLNLDLNDGSLLDERQYGSTIRDEYGTDIIRLTNGGFFITSTMLYPTDSSKYFLIETTPSLDTIPKLSRYVGQSNVFNYSTKSFERQNSITDQFICFGSIFREVNLQKSFWFTSNIYTSGIDQLTFDFYGSTAANEYCTDVYKTTDDGFILSGYIESGSINNEMLVKVNANRDPVWSFPYPNEYNKSIQIPGVIQTQDGGYMVSSTIELDDPKNNEISLLKIDSEGAEQWRKTYGSNDNDVGSKVVQLQDGGYVVVGTIGFEINPNSLSKMCLMKVNSEGELVPMGE